MPHFSDVSENHTLFLPLHIYVSQLMLDCSMKHIEVPNERKFKEMM